MFRNPRLVVNGQHPNMSARQFAVPTMPMEPPSCKDTPVDLTSAPCSYVYARLPYKSTTGGSKLPDWARTRIHLASSPHLADTRVIEEVRVHVPW
jgi:hypothetical protein